MKLSIQAGATSQTINVFVRNSASSLGAGLTGLAYNTASLVAYYSLPGAAAVQIVLATQTVTGAWATGGFVEISSANMPGWYRLDLPNAVLASGNFVSLLLWGAANMAPLPVEIELTAWNNQDAVAGGLSRIDAAISSRSTYAGADTSGTTTLLTRIPGTVAAQTGDSYARIGAAGVGLTNLGDTRIANLDAAVSTRTKPADTQAAVTSLTNAPTAGDFTAAMKASLNAATPTGGDTAGTTTLLTRIPGTVQPQTGDAYARIGAAGAGLTALGDARLADLDAAVSTRLATAGYTAPDNADIAAIKTTLGTPSGASVSADIAAIPAAVWASATRSLTTFGTLVADVATAVWAAATRTLSAFDFTVTTDVSATVTTNLDAAVSTRLATAGYTAPDNADITAIKAKTDNLPAAPADETLVIGATNAIMSRLGVPAGASVSADIAAVEAGVGSIPTATENADALLTRDWTALSGEAIYSALNALRNMRNHVVISGSTVTVYKEDGATVAYTLAITTDSTQDPIVTVTP